MSAVGTPFFSSFSSIGSSITWRPQAPRSSLLHRNPQRLLHSCLTKQDLGRPHGAPRKCGLVFCLACSSLLPPRSMSCEARYCLFFKQLFFRRPVTHSDSKFNCWLIRPILHSFGWTSLFNWMVWSRIKRHSLFSSSPCRRMPPQKLVPSKPSSFLASAWSGKVALSRKSSRKTHRCWQDSTLVMKASLNLVHWCWKCCHSPHHHHCDLYTSFHSVTFRRR